MAILSTLIAFSVAKKVAVLTAAYAYGLPRVYRVVLRATRVHVAQPSARAMIARSTSRTLRTLRLPAKAVAAVRARLVQGTGGTAAGAGADPSAAASAASATASSVPSQPLPRARTEGAAANKASAAGLALLLSGGPPVAGKAVPLSAGPPMGGTAGAWVQQP
ncbi:hypothetical protein I4F81_006951 [Pyropia yezoensis]|uniref:Uncharacterized protein n=1 Tax=Pyropia yezoensis TaxID=2788 RepID=A0ACC3C3G8_PYRYE|nr:hypothetical protein I4F81_006951 [Neopyropia yezoensis]